MHNRWMWLLSLVFLLGCDKDPYGETNVPAKANPQMGSYQDVLNEGAKKDDKPIKAERWKVELGNAYLYGNANAPVTIVEFSDFECPFCSRGADRLKKLVKKYKGKVRLYFKHFPLSFHKKAHLASQAALAAGKQGKFWEYHDELFANQKKLSRRALIRYAKKLKLEMKSFKKALKDKTYKKQVDDDLAQGENVGVSGTPTVFVNGRQSSVDETKLSDIIDEELRHVKTFAKKKLKGNALYNEIIKDGKTKGIQKKAGDNKEEPVVRKSVPVGRAPVQGNPDAPVTIVEFSDFECPYCSRAARTVAKVKKAYGDKVRVAFKHFPLSFHRNAKLAAQASMAAHDQGKFWEYHDLLFANMKQLQRPFLLQYAKKLELDVQRFTQKMDAISTVAHVDADSKQGGVVGVRGTPTVFVNGIQMKSVGSFDDFKEVIDKELIAKGYKESDLPEEPGEDIPIEGAAYKGNPDAKVTIVEFSDFECPFCSRAGNTMNELADAYGDKIQVVFKHYPLSFHKKAHLASQAAIAAQAQGKFWEYHDKLFANQKKLGKADLLRYAKELNLDMVKFQASLDAGVYKQQVDDDLALGSKVGVSGTPTVFINGRKAEGVSYTKLKEQIDPILLKNGYKKSDLPKEPTLEVGNAPTKGNPKAKVTILEFSDFECPFCSRAGKAVNEFVKYYGKYVRLAFKQFPLSFHKNAHLASQAALAAHEQGKFWEYHDLLFANQRQLKRPSLERYAQQLGLDMAKFNAALDSGKYKKQVDKDMRVGSRFGVSGTPTMFINGEKAEGWKFEDLKKQIDPILLENGVKKKDLPRRPPKVIKLGNAPYKGSPKSPVKLVEFSDFECPFCSRAANLMNELAKAYGDKIQIFFKQYPLGFHKNAHLAAQASLAAHEQGKFWEYHDLLFANQRQLKRPSLERYAQQLGLDMAKFNAALNSGKYKKRVDEEMANGSYVGVNGTPSFFINNKPVRGYTFEKMKAAIDPILLKHGYKKSDLPSKPLKVIRIADDDPSKGNPKAKVTVVEFSDFECPFCSRAAITLQKVAKTYGDQVRIVFKQFPLSFHKNAHLASQAALAANEQGKFWAYHDLLFANQKKLKRADLERYAQQLSMDMGAFKQALDSGKYKGRVNADMREGGRVGVSGTPSFYVNNKPLKGSSFDAVKKAVDAALAAAKKPKPAPRKAAAPKPVAPKPGAAPASQKAGTPKPNSVKNAPASAPAAPRGPQGPGGAGHHLRLQGPRGPQGFRPQGPQGPQERTAPRAGTPSTAKSAPAARQTNAAANTAEKKSQ